MSAPMPPELQSGATGQVVYRHKPTLDEVMTPRRLHIPTFYPGHPDPNAIVKKSNGEVLVAPFDGEPVRVGEIPVERRWAVCTYDRDTGRLVAGDTLLDKTDYRNLYQRWRMEFYDLVSEKRNIDNIKFEGRIEAEPIPGIIDFVLVEVDPHDDRKVNPMHYTNRTAGAVPEVLVDSKGEHGKSRDEALKDAYLKSPDALKPNEREYVEGSLLGRDDPMVQLTDLSRKLIAREITREEYDAQVREIAEAADVPSVGTLPTQRVEMACGKKVWPSKQEVHLATCDVCGGEEAA